MADKVALVAGANVIIGKALMEALAGAAGWTARPLSRRPPLRNLLDGVDAAGAQLQHVVLYQGAKIYGVRLGPAPTPKGVSRQKIKAFCALSIACWTCASAAVRKVFSSSRVSGFTVANVISSSFLMKA